MNILILNWRDPKHPKSGGAEIVTLEHAKAWSKNGNKVTWLSSKFPGSKKQEVIDGIHVVRYGTSLTVHLFAFFFYLFSGEQFDIVIDEIHGIPFFTPLYVRKPKVAFIHEVAEAIWDEMYPFPLNIIGKFIERVYMFMYKSINFITVSESTKSDLVRFGIPKRNIHKFPNGLSLVPIQTFPKKEKNLTLICVSRLVKMKGIEHTIEIFAKIHALNPQSQLWVVGNGDIAYIAFLKEYVKKLQIQHSVVFYGFVSEQKKKRLYQKAHFLISTSLKEGFGLVVIEANSQATPAVTYDSPGLRDIVHNKKNGFLFTDQQHTYIVAKILKLYKNKIAYKKLCWSSHQYATTFQWDTITKQSLSFLQNHLVI